jgi:hypothetical protein
LRARLLVLPATKRSPMTTESPSSAEAPYWSLAGLREGAWRAGPLLPGTMIF